MDKHYIKTSESCKDLFWKYFFNLILIYIKLNINVIVYR